MVFGEVFYMRYGVKMIEISNIEVTFEEKLEALLAKRSELMEQLDNKSGPVNMSLSSEIGSITKEIARVRVSHKKQFRIRDFYNSSRTV
jgi:hypothetical protein